MAKTESEIVEEYYRRYQDGARDCERTADRRVVLLAGVGLLAMIVLLSWRGYCGQWVGAATLWTLALVIEMISHRFGTLAHNVAAKQLMEDGLGETLEWGGWASRVCAMLNVCATVLCALGFVYVAWFLCSIAP